MTSARLIFVNRYYWPDHSATSQMLTDLAEGLAAAGHSVTVVTSRQRLDDPGAGLIPAERRNGVAIERLWTSRFGRANLLGRALDYLTFYLSAAWSMLLCVARGDIVVAKTDPPLLGTVIGPLVRLKGGRLVNWWQDVYPEVAIRLGVLPENFLTRFLVRWRNASLRKAWRNVAVGERMRDYLASVEPRAARIDVIPNWSPDLAWTPAPSEDNSFRRQLGLRGKVVFGYSGNLGRAHPIEALLEAGERLKARSDIHFLFVGAGANWDRLRSEVARRGLPNWSFLPPQARERLADSLGASDVHLVLLDQALEGLIVPSKLYGALTAARPVLFVGDPRAEVARVLHRHDCGLGVSTEGDAIQSAVERLAADPGLRARLGASARRTYADVYMPERALELWTNCLSVGPRT